MLFLVSNGRRAAAQNDDWLVPRRCFLDHPLVQLLDTRAICAGVEVRVGIDRMAQFAGAGFEKSLPEPVPDAGWDFFYLFFRKFVFFSP